MILTILKFYSLFLCHPCTIYFSFSRSFMNSLKVVLYGPSVEIEEIRRHELYLFVIFSPQLFSYSLSQLHLVKTWPRQLLRKKWKKDEKLKMKMKGPIPIKNTNFNSGPNSCLNFVLSHKKSLTLGRYPTWPSSNFCQFSQ